MYVQTISLITVIINCSLEFILFKVAAYIYLEFPVFYVTFAFGQIYNEYT